MDIDELQSVQSRERQTDSLQQLRESFYREASDYLQTLRDERDRAAERADDPWDDPEVSRLTDEINTAEQAVEAIYDRRTGKVVKKASLAAAGMPADEDGLTREERALFESLVDEIEDNRDHVLDMIAGELTDDDAVPQPNTGSTDASADAAQQSPDAGAPDAEATADRPTGAAGDPAAPDDGVSAADVMGDSGTAGDTGTGERSVPPDEPAGPDGGEDAQSRAESQPAPPTEHPPADAPSADHSSTDRSLSDSAAGEDGPAESGPAGGQTGDTVDRQTVRITADVGEILGVDERSYDLGRDDVVQLPADNVGPLIERDAAERLD